MGWYLHNWCYAGGRTGAYKIESESEFSENIGIIGRQINDAVVSYNYAGAAVYGYGSLFGGSDRGAQEQECIEIAFDKLDTSVKWYVIYKLWYVKCKQIVIYYYKIYGSKQKTIEISF